MSKQDFTRMAIPCRSGVHQCSHPPYAVLIRIHPVSKKEFKRPVAGHGQDQRWIAEPLRNEAQIHSLCEQRREFLHVRGRDGSGEPRALLFPLPAIPTP
jgi:hypothetical protein